MAAYYVEIQIGCSDCLERTNPKSDQSMIDDGLTGGNEFMIDHALYQGSFTWFIWWCFEGVAVINGLTNCSQKNLMKLEFEI